MMLRTARCYDADSDTIIFANNKPFTREAYSSAGVDKTPERLFGFCKKMGVMQVDNAEYSLLSAITIFSGRFKQDPNKNYEPWP